MTDKANYYGCEGKHAEHTCNMYRYVNKRFTWARFCDPCKARYAKDVVADGE